MLPMKVELQTTPRGDLNGIWNRLRVSHEDGGELSLSLLLEVFEATDPGHQVAPGWAVGVGISEGDQHLLMGEWSSNVVSAGEAYRELSPLSLLA